LNSGQEFYGLWVLEIRPSLEDLCWLALSFFFLKKKTNVFFTLVLGFCFFLYGLLFLELVLDSWPESLISKINMCWLFVLWVLFLKLIYFNFIFQHFIYLKLVSLLSFFLSFLLSYLNFVSMVTGFARYPSWLKLFFVAMGLIMGLWPESLVKRLTHTDFF